MTVVKCKDPTVTKSKSSSWLSKWVPVTFAKKAKEAFKLIERAIFAEEYIDEKETSKIEVLENQVKLLQNQVNKLTTAATQLPEASVAITKQNNVSQCARQSSVLVSSRKVLSFKNHEATTTKPVQPSPQKQIEATTMVNKPLPFGASDLQAFSFRTRSMKIPSSSLVTGGSVPSAAPTAKPVPPTPITTSVTVPVVPMSKPPPPPLHSMQLLTSTTFTAASPPAVRMVPKLFNSSDLRKVKLGAKNRTEQKSSVSVKPSAHVDASQRPISAAMLMGVTLKSAGDRLKTPGRSKTNRFGKAVKSAVKTVSLQSALKNAIRSKFDRANNKEEQEQESDSEWNE